MGEAFKSAIEFLFIWFRFTARGAYENIITAIVDLPSNSIISMVDTTVVGLGVSFATAFLAMEVFSMAAEFKTERIEDAIRIGMKFVVFKIIIENTNGICNGLYNMLCTDLGGTNGIVNDVMGLIDKIIMKMITSDDIETTWKAIFRMDGIFDLIGTLATVIISISIMISVAMTLIGVVFEITIHNRIAPLALSTLVNSTTRQTGISFIKSYVAVCLQFFIIRTILSVGGDVLILFENTFEPTAANSLFSSALSALGPILGLMMISSSIKKSGDITKRLLGT